MARMKTIRQMAESSAQFHREFAGGTRRRQAGMTLIEIIIVVALLGTLMTYLVTSLTNTAEQAKVDQTQLAMGAIAQSLQMYKVHNNRFPTSDKGLDALVNNPGGSKKWRGPYIEQNKLQDPWGQEFNYESDGRKYEIISAGIDNEFGNADDIFYPERAGDAGDE